jgi:hypothetical protein
MNRAWLLTAFALVAAGLFGQAKTAADVVARVRAMRAATDFTASGRLVRVEAGGERKPHQISMRAKAFADGTSLLCEVSDPAPARIRALIRIPTEEQPVIRVARPGDAAPRVLPFANWADALLDSNLSYEDLIEGHFTWSKQTALAPARYGARDCHVLKSEPGSGDRSHYASVTSWLDQEIYYPVKAEKVLKGSGIVKEFLYYGLRKSKGLWSASQIEVRTKGKPYSTFLIITRGSGKASLTRADFDPRLLTRK